MRNGNKIAVQKPLLTSVSTYSAGDLVDLEGVFGRFGFTATWSGTAPTDLSFSVFGSLDGVVISEIANRRMTSSSDLFAVEGTPARYVKGVYNARTDGDTDTEISLSVTAGGE